MDKLSDFESKSLKDSTSNRQGVSDKSISTSESVKLASSKAKSLQQGHQFRAPQQFVRHKKITSSVGSKLSTNKKNRTWNKKQKNNKMQSIGNILTHKIKTFIQPSSVSSENIDLENIRNIENYSCTQPHKISCNSESKNNTLVPAAHDHGFLQQQHVHRRFSINQRSHYNLASSAMHYNLSTCSGTANGAVNSCCGAGDCSVTGAKDVLPPGGNSTSTAMHSCASANNHCCIRSKFFLPDKRPRKGNIIPPTKFLLGGNISDPLNLNSLQNESQTSSFNNTPATTPRQSPITTPPKVEVIIPPNIHDPLHLLDPVDSREYEKQLTSPMKRGIGLTLKSLNGSKGLNKAHKHRQRKNRKTKRRRYESSNSLMNALIDDPDSSKFLNISDSTEVSNKTIPSMQQIKSNSAESNAVKLNKLASCEELSSLSNNGQEASSDMGGSTKADEGILIKQDKNRDLVLDLCPNVNAGEPTPCSINHRKRKLSESISQKNKKYHRSDSMDKIVSPVVPQPGAWARQIRSTATGARKTTSKSVSGNDSNTYDEPGKVPATDITKDSSEIHNMETEMKSNLKSNFSAAEHPQVLDTVPQSPSTEVSNTKRLKPSKTNACSNDSKKSELPSFKAANAKYCYGNYKRYDGFRNLNEFMDVRLKVFQRFPELFKDKDVLDIGCNVGQITISIAQKLAPKSILGIDIDKELISQARRNLGLHVLIPEDLKKNSKTQIQPQANTKRGKNLKKSKNYLASNSFSHLSTDHFHQHHNNQQIGIQGQREVDLFPVSFPLTYGCVVQMPDASVNIESHSPVSTTTVTNTPGHLGGATISRSSVTTNSLKHNRNFKSKHLFPNNVFFRTTNYVLNDESQLANDMQQYDLILCLSVTKWIHLNFGDNGLKLAFKRMFNQLRPGGKLILEAQNWASYKRKKNLTAKILSNYNKIELFPNKFHEYLLSSEVGFSHSYTLGVPRHLNKGFSRPIQLYAKGDYTPNHVRWSDAYCPQTPYETYRGIYATMPPLSMQLSYPVASSIRSQNCSTPRYMGDNNSGSYSCRQTPIYQSSISQYYNPLETDSYLPSYDVEYLNHMYVFASPLYQTAWSPPTSMQYSSSHTPIFGSVRDSELDGDGNTNNNISGSFHRHVYPPNDELSSPNTNAASAFNSIRDTDTDDSNQLSVQRHKPHVYATNCEEGTSPSRNQPNLNDLENSENALLLDDDERTLILSPSCCDFHES
uniref:RNA methyltransferase n=1 Tax=Glossina brevipalpis TaxID=37001 RepID=A0A1A9WHX8_9MUSC